MDQSQKPPNKIYSNCPAGTIEWIQLDSVESQKQWNNLKDGEHMWTQHSMGENIKNDFIDKNWWVFEWVTPHPNFFEVCTPTTTTITTWIEKWAGL